MGREGDLLVMNTIDIARVTHEVNRAIQAFQGDPDVSPAWDDAPVWQRESAIYGVMGALNGNTPEQSHESWLAQKEADGWIYGPIKDEDVKTHPCLLPYNLLPDEQKIKDHVFVAIVQALSTELNKPVAAVEPDDTGLRVEALRLATMQSQNYGDVIDFAESFLKFLKGEASDR